VRIGVDSCIIVAGVHANHPWHAVAASWLVNGIGAHDLVVAHHSVLEAYAVLTRLPGDLRLLGSEARELLRATIQGNMQVARFRAASIWTLLDSIVARSASGGRSYDAFALEVLRRDGVEAIATFNVAHFSELDPDLPIIDPSKPAG
jgi:predicted nucleic acid-binding protein